MQGICNYDLPGKPGLYYYTQNVFCKMLKLPGSGYDYLSRSFVLWLTPICKCGKDLTISIIPMDDNGMFWYARCTNNICDISKVKPRELKYLIQAYLHQHPDEKAKIMGLITN